MEDVIVCGVGALGSRIASDLGSLARSMRLIDFDRIEESNILSGTTIFHGRHETRYKVEVVAELVFRRFGTLVVPDKERLTDQTVRGYDAFEGARLVVDCFDNMRSRACLTRLAAPCLHVAVSNGGTGIIQWGDSFIPSGQQRTASPPNRVCTHQLGQKLLLFTSTVATIAALDFLETGRQRNLVVTANMSVVE
jgi:predicted ThiF/HesA family dinucleotide-utilizing enzyme